MWRRAGIILGIWLSSLLYSQTKVSPSDLVGVWNVIMKCNYSTSSNTHKGDIYSQQWLINLEGNEFVVEAKGGRKTMEYIYRGSLNEKGDTLWLHVLIEDKVNKASIGVELQILSPAHMKGRRVVGGCGYAIVYEVEMKKQ